MDLGELKDSMEGTGCVVCAAALTLPGLRGVTGDPRVLPCLHLVCPGCAQGGMGTSPTGIFTCPACRTKVQAPTVSSPRQLKTLPAFFMKTLGPDTQGVDNNSSDLRDTHMNGSSSDGVVCPAEGSNDTVSEDNQDITETQKTETLDSRGCENMNGLDSGSPGRCTELEGDPAEGMEEYYCTTCDKAVVSGNIEQDHWEHDLVKLPHMLKSKKDYIETLLKQVHTKVQRSQDVVRQISVVKAHLSRTRDELEKEIEDRCAYLVEMIERRKQTLLQELHKVCNAQQENFDTEAANQKQRIKVFNDAYNFAQKVISEGTDRDLLTFHNDITNRLLQLIHHLKDASLEILSLRVDVPERGREESHLEKLFGSLMQGNISCGDAEMLLSFNVDLKWPTSLVTTKTRDIVIAGKAGTFDSQGRLLFYDRQGNLHSGHEFEDKCIPNDVLCAPDGSILVTDNVGRILKFNPQGKIFEILEDKFKGSSGRLAMTTDSQVLVTSTEDRCVWKYDVAGEKLGRLPQSSEDEYSALSQPHCLTTNLNNDFVLSDLKGHNVSVYDSDGLFKFRYTGGDFNELKCPSSICCDPFNNILVADFTSDVVHLVSPSGEFLGYLLTKDNGISCPNFISLDHEGHLFVGQYGGEISVFRYLSCIKHA